MFGRLGVSVRTPCLKTPNFVRKLCAEAELLVEDGSKSRSARPLRPIYFDLQASTPLDPRVLDAMLPFISVTSVTLIHVLMSMAGKVRRLLKTQERMWQTLLMLTTRKLFSPVVPLRV
ncbi:unnamed protein product [Heterobilharzia americana]|nr:unnamed protein product [Heterobilharzia americana]